MAGLAIERILIDGAVLTAIAAPVMVLALYINPRIVLSSYPPDVQAAVPSRTRKELRQAILLSIPFSLAALAVPLLSTWLLSRQNGGTIPYWIALASIFGVHSVFLFLT